VSDETTKPRRPVPVGRLQADSVEARTTRGICSRRASRRSPDLVEHAVIARRRLSRRTPRRCRGHRYVFVWRLLHGRPLACYWVNAKPWTLGATMGGGLFFLGVGLIAWGKYLMPRGPFVEERHELATLRRGP
jgi:hypothetical protein